MSMRQTTRRMTRIAVVATGAATMVIGLGAMVASRAQETVQAPRFEVDPMWPKPLPNNWVIGSAIGLSIDSRDHVFMVHRYRGLNPRVEVGAAQNPPISECCTPAPPVLEFDPQGNLVRAWGGPGQGFDWPGSEHGITVDSKGNIWLAGNGGQDRHLLKFTGDGKFLQQFGKPAPGPANSLSTTDFAGAAMIHLDEKANEAYIADGYRNKRVAVMDMTTGEIKRFWGAYGNKPDDSPQPAYHPDSAPSQQFGNPLHCASMSNDHFVYVADRKNNRIQVFHPDGKFIREVKIAPKTLRSAKARCGRSRSRTMRHRSTCTSPTARTSACT
jgi:hypothetical protein